MCDCVYCGLPIVNEAATILGGEPLHPHCAEESMDSLYGDEREECSFDDDGQPTEYQEWQDYMGGDDWDHGQYAEDYGDWGRDSAYEE